MAVMSIIRVGPLKYCVIAVGKGDMILDLNNDTELNVASEPLEGASDQHA
jgi:hypothetical protein